MPAASAPATTDSSAPAEIVVVEAATTEAAVTTSSSSSSAAAAAVAATANSHQQTIGSFTTVSIVLTRLDYFVLWILLRPRRPSSAILVHDDALLLLDGQSEAQERKLHTPHYKSDDFSSLRWRHKPPDSQAVPLSHGEGKALVAHRVVHKLEKKCDT